MVGYIAGFYEGEGCAATRHGRGRIHPQIRIGQKDPTALKFIQKELGMGRIYSRQRGEQTYYSLVIYPKSDVRRFIRLIYRHVQSPRRRADLRRVYLSI